MVAIYNREIICGSEFRNKMMEGINELADIVGSTLGPKGKLVAIKLGYQDPIYTKDGVTVARNVFFPNSVKNLGSETISGAALRTGSRVGDGTTTCTVLARALLASGHKIVPEHVDIVEKHVRACSRPVTGYDDWYAVAFISANGDDRVAALIADTLQAVGMDGQITIELMPETGLRSEIVSGMSLARGYCSPYFVTDTQKMIAELDNPLILVLDKNLITLEHIFEKLQKTAKAGRSLLIIAREIGGDALQTLILNKVKNGVKVAAVSAAGLTNDFLEDVAISAGASLTDQTFGSAKKVIIHHDKTIIVEGGGDPQQIEDRCAMLREGKVKDRLARLSGGIAVLRVGGHTEAEASERMDRVDDALNATRSAIEEGIVAGGGAALYHAGASLPEGAVKTATEAPIRQIMKNAGVDTERTLGWMSKDGIVDGDINVGFIVTNDLGYDARAMQHCSMTEAGIVDPVKVVCSALRDAVSVASLVLNTEAAIVEGVEK